MSTLPTNRFELKAIAYSTPEVGTYCDHLQVRYPTIADMKELRVMRVNLIKEMASTVQHEYVSVTVQDRNKGVAYICFERNRGDERRQALLAKSQSPSPYDAGAPQNVIPSSISSFHLGRNSLFSIASLDSAKKTYHAQDVVMLTVETLKYLYDTVARSLKLHGDTESLYLYQLVILANTLHNASIEYELFRKNCYWYVGVLFELLEGLLESKSTLGNCRNGVWGGISLYKQESLKDLARVKQEFVKNSAAFEHEEVQRLKIKEESQLGSQSGSATRQQDQRSEVQYHEEAERHLQLTEQKMEEERQWKREERRLRELAELRASEAERANKEKDKKLRQLEERLEGFQPFLESQNLKIT